MKAKKGKIWITLLLGVLISTTFIILNLYGVLSLWQNRLSDMLNREIRPSEDIIIVGVDDITLDPEIGLGKTNDWSREIYAQALDNLNKYNPKVVAFDVLFRSPRDEDGDKHFKEALEKTSNPIILYIDDPKYDENENLYKSKDELEIKILPQNLFAGIENITIALGKFEKDADDVIRKYILEVKDNDKKYPTLGFAAAALFAEIDPSKIPTEKGLMPIRYFTNPSIQTKDYTYVSFLHLYNDKYKNFNPSYFRNKLVFIGKYSVTEEEKQDLYYTPTDPSYRMYGVEVHANAAQTILNRDFLRNMTPLEKSALVTLLACLSAFVFMFTRIRWSLLYLFAVPTAYAFSAKPLFNAGIIPDMVHPYLVIATAFVATYIYRYFTEFKEKSALKGAFSKYVSPAVMDEIMSEPQKLNLGGEKREITVMFTDIAHFTSISEKLSPESLVALLNEYLEAMTDVIMSEGGTVDKYEGDAIMAYFGAPLAQTDHAVRACATALKMREKLAELLNKWKTDPPLPGGEKKPEIDFRCGLSMGEAIVGNVGSSSRLEYTAIGDIVNLGSRLEGANKKYLTNVLVSEATYEAVKEHFEAREIDTIRVVGKAKPIKVYELLNYKGKLVPEAVELLRLYNEGIQFYHTRKFEAALSKFTQLLGKYPDDGPSKLYKQRCDVLKDIPPPADWDGVFELGSK
jgi:adenylate cyclase